MPEITVTHDPGDGVANRGRCPHSGAMPDPVPQVPPLNSETESVEARLITLERQTQWLSIELDGVRAVLLSVAAVTNDGLHAAD